nr:NADH-ubiquinone oxidoreductase-F iron-sulfur binding region domain-containing protein [uncultured Clostridium sp.]
METDRIGIFGHGIKGRPSAERWSSREWKELICLFPEDQSESGNAKYLLEHYLDEVISGMEALRDRLELSSIRALLSRNYEIFEEKFRLRGIQTELTDDMKGAQKEIFKEGVLVHHGETMLALHRYLTDENYVPHKIVALTGDVMEPGIYEIPFGITLEEIITKYGKGVTAGKTVKFVSAGGSMGAVYGADELDTPFTYSSLLKEGTMLETAKLEVFSNDTCIVDWTCKRMLLNSRKTCGTCVYCREGIYQLFRILQDAAEGKGRDGDLSVMKEICDTLKAGTLCDIGRTAAVPLFTAMKKFGEEFEKHIDRKICQSLSCISYVKFYIDPAVCSGCGDCMACPEHAVRGGENLIHIIDTDLCTKCEMCTKVCMRNAVRRYGTVKPILPSEPAQVGSFSGESNGMKKGLGRKRRV